MICKKCKKDLSDTKIDCQLTSYGAYCMKCKESFDTLIQTRFK